MSVTVVDCTNDADDSEDEAFSNVEMVSILSFFNDSSVQELGSVPGLSVKKAEKIIKMRPFDSWNDLVSCSGFYEISCTSSIVVGKEYKRGINCQIL